MNRVAQIHPQTRRRDRLRAAVATSLLHAIRGGSLTVVGTDGTRTTYGDGQPDHRGRAPIDATVRLRHPAALGRILTGGSVELGLSYAQGWWTTDDLTATLRLLDRNVRRLDPALALGRRLARPVATARARRRRPDLDRDRAEVRAHYDQGNDFFELLLDDTMMYSAAVFDHPCASLEQASRRKIELLAEAACLGPDDHVLEIGTGWGGLAIHLAREYGCRVTTTTISDAQFRYASQRVHEAGLDGRVTVLDRDFRELTGTYDAVVSVEMIEAVDWREYPTFFESCERLLAPNGRLVMQAILIPEQRYEMARDRKDFIKEVIFPGGGLPSLRALHDASIARTDLSLTSVRDIGLHYGETLRRWRANLDAAGPRLAGLGFDRERTRLWEFYLAYCEAGFDERDITVSQLLFARPGWEPEAPFARPLELVARSG